MGKYLKASHKTRFFIEMTLEEFKTFIPLQLPSNSRCFTMKAFNVVSQVQKAFTGTSTEKVLVPAIKDAQSNVLRS